MEVIVDLNTFHLGGDKLVSSWYFVSWLLFYVFRTLINQYACIWRNVTDHIALFGLVVVLAKPAIEILKMLKMHSDGWYDSSA